MGENYTKSDLYAMNGYRLCLQVECLLDNCTADGIRSVDPGLQTESLFSLHRA
jgi:hypothetical protein